MGCVSSQKTYWFCTAVSAEHKVPPAKFTAPVRQGVVVLVNPYFEGLASRPSSSEKVSSTLTFIPALAESDAREGSGPAPFTSVVSNSPDTVDAATDAAGPSANNRGVFPISGVVTIRKFRAPNVARSSIDVSMLATMAPISAWA